MLAIDHYSALHADSDVDAVVTDIHNTAIQDHDDDEPGVEWEAEVDPPEHWDYTDAL